MAMPELTIKDGLGTNQTVNAHLGADGSYTPTHSRDTNAATYSAGGQIVVANMAASLSELLLISGSASKVVRVKSIRLDGGATTGENRGILLRKHSVANTGGTAATAPDKVPLDSGDAAASAVVKVYTANPTVDSGKKTVAAAGLTFSALTLPPGVVEFTPVDKYEKAFVLRGVAEELAIDFAGTTPGAGAVLNWNIVWSEESES